MFKHRPTTIILLCAVLSFCSQGQEDKEADAGSQTHSPGNPVSTSAPAHDPAQALPVHPTSTATTHPGSGSRPLGAQQSELDQPNPFVTPDPVQPEQEFELGAPVRFNWSSYQESLPVFVLIGGSQECTTETHPGLRAYDLGMLPEFQRLLESVKQRTGIRPDFVLVCYEQRRSYFGGIGAIRVAGGRTALPDQTVPESDLSAHLHQYAGGRKLALIGDSYGGWLAMLVARDMIQKAWLPVDFLVTIDPISATACTRIFARGCTRAPEDIAPAERIAIAEHASGWLHFYQRVTRVLMSSDIPEASERVKRALPHYHMGTNDRIWDHISNRILQD